MTYNGDGKRKVKCVDGPFKGATLWLTDGKSAIFEYRGQRGYYQEGRWRVC
jgi:hypothetical protein